MICIDSNILIYAFNRSSQFYEPAKNLIKQKIVNDKIAICDISLIEFFQVITDKKRLKIAINTDKAQEIIQSIIKNDSFEVLHLNSKIFEQVFSTAGNFNIEKYEIYDHIIANICKYYSITDFNTVNTKDFRKYDFLNIINPFNSL